MNYDIGGLTGQPIHNYLHPAWLSQLESEPAAFRFTGFRTGKTEVRFPWKKHLEWMPQDMPWPPPGVALTLEFDAPLGMDSAARPSKIKEGAASDFFEPGALERCRVAEFRILGDAEPSVASPARPNSGLKVEIHYELYDGLPLLSKWLVLRNGTDKPLRLNSFTSEILAAVEPESAVDPTAEWQPMPIHLETDYAFGGMSPLSRGQAVHWLADKTYTSQVNYDLKTPCLLECRPPLGPDQIIAPGGSFESFRV